MKMPFPVTNDSDSTLKYMHPPYHVLDLLSLGGHAMSSFEALPRMSGRRGWNTHATCHSPPHIHTYTYAMDKTNFGEACHVAFQFFISEAETCKENSNLFRWLVAPRHLLNYLCKALQNLPALRSAALPSGLPQPFKL